MLGQAYRRRVGRGQRGGFTLIELLVAVAVISVLLSILLPALNTARLRAKQTVCGTRLRQWGLALGYYAALNNDFWPHCDGLDREDFDPNNPDRRPPNAPPWQLANWHGWVDLLPPLIGLPRWRDYPRRQHPDQRTFYQCPTGELRDDANYDYNPRRNGYFSYAMNSCLELDEGCWPLPGDAQYDVPLPSFLNTLKITWPGRVIVLFDQLLDTGKGFGGGTEYRSAGKHCGSYPIAFAARHAHGPSELGGNTLFADGHVEWWPTVWRQEWGPWDIRRQQAPPRDDPNWYPYPPP